MAKSTERELKEGAVSVLIVGGGVNGIGVFWDLAHQGIDVMLVEQKDFCSGSSATSSHMAHGGIRYLENGEFRLVREAVQERNRLFENAPHYVKPLRTTIPIFKWFSGLLNAPLKFLRMLDRPAERGLVVIKAGLMMYDAYTRSQKTVPKHRIAFQKKSLASFPKLNPEIICTATYYDGAILAPERLCVEMILDAEQANPPAKAYNYVSLKEAHGRRVTLKDELTGLTATVEPAILINAAGPWIDLTNEKLGRATRYIQGTKGSHIVLDNPQLRLAIGDHEFFFENKDGRIVLVFPFGDKVLLGTSDIPVGDPDQVHCTEEEIDYFIEIIGVVFPDIRVTREQIVFRFSGVRPLPHSDAKTTGQISRDHQILTDSPGEKTSYPVLNLVGGKWTTFRAFAEQVSDRVLSYLGKIRVTSTQNIPIGGGRDYPQTAKSMAAWVRYVSEQTGLDEALVERLLGRYGTQAGVIAGYISAAPDRPLLELPGWSEREIAYLIMNEYVHHLDDFILRRSKLAMSGQITLPVLEELSQIAGSVLGWTDDRRRLEVERTRKILAAQHGVTL